MGGNVSILKMQTTEHDRSYTIKIDSTLLIHFDSDSFSGYSYIHAKQFSSWSVIIFSPLGMPEKCFHFIGHTMHPMGETAFGIHNLFINESKEFLGYVQKLAASTQWAFLVLWSFCGRSSPPQLTRTKGTIRERSENELGTNRAINIVFT